MDEWVERQLKRRYPKADEINVLIEHPYHDSKPTRWLKVFGKQQDGKPISELLQLTLAPVKEWRRD